MIPHTDFDNYLSKKYSDLEISTSVGKIIDSNKRRKETMLISVKHIMLFALSINS